MTKRYAAFGLVMILVVLALTGCCIGPVCF